MNKILKPLSDFLLENDLPSSDNILKKFKQYINLLMESPHNVTSIKNPNEIIIKHFIDSLFLLKFYRNFTKNKKIIDIGTGAGFPGVPLKILFPEIELYLVESVGKKVEFLKVLIDNLDISGIIIINERAEILVHKSDFREQFDIVLSRAVANLSTLLEITSPFAKVGKTIVAYKGKKVREELRSAQKAMEMLNLIIKDIYFYKLTANDYERSLVFFEKTKNTPNKFPRRPGIPQKRPIT